jgi:zinc transport system ATP-binding protein
LITSEKHSNASSVVQLSAQNVSVIFGADVALRDVSFTIRKGEFVGLVGQNGSGKTTLLRVLLGLLRPTTGQAGVHQATVGYVPQRGQLYSGIVPMSVLEVVGLGSRGNKAKARQALKSVGMEEFEGQRFNALSGGQQQRVVIAKALASGANVLILDEPTTGVDKANQAEFYKLLKRLHHGGHTIVMVSHDVDSVMSLVSRVICLNRQIVYDGSPKEFDSEHHLRSLYAVDAHRGGDYV